MPINYAKKYNKELQKVFRLGKMTTGFSGHRAKFTGVKTLAFYALPTTATGAYDASGGLSRFGTPSEQGDTVKEYSITQDRAWTLTVDHSNADDTMNVKTNGAIVSLQTEEEVIPEKDSYCITTLVGNAVANGGSATANLTKDTVYTSFLAATEYLSEKKVPLKGRICAMPFATYSLLKLSGFIKESETGQKMLINGKIGEVDGVQIRVLPSFYFPAKVNFLMFHPRAVFDAEEYDYLDIKTNPAGLHGRLFEARYKYDTFIDEKKKDAFYVHQAV